jgi:hypothetical protein
MPDIYDDHIFRAAIGLEPLRPLPHLHLLTVPHGIPTHLAMTDAQCLAYRQQSTDASCTPCQTHWRPAPRKERLAHVHPTPRPSRRLPHTPPRSPGGSRSA